MVISTATSTGTGYLPTGSRPRGVPRLFCFHHAGGAASAYGDWQRALGPGVEVLPVQLPGRESRVREPRFTDMRDLVDDLDAQLDAELDVPHFFYGHSMGAAVAHALTRRRAERGATLPERLLVGAYQPPHVRAPITAAIRMSDDELARWLVGIGGMSELLLSYPEWALAAVAMVRDDLRVCASHHEDVPVALPCPIDVFTGVDDPLLTVAQARGWARHTTVDFRLRPVPGGHFFVRDSRDVVLRLLGETVTGGVRTA